MVSKSKQKKRSKNKQFELRMILLGIVSLTLFLVSLLIYLYKSESIIDKYNIIASDFSDSSFSISFSTLQPKYFQAVLLTEGEGISKLISSKATSETEDIRIIERVSDTFKPGYYTHYYTFKKIDPNESYRVALKDSTGRLWKTDKVIFPEDWEERHKVQKGDSDPLPLSGSVSYEGEFVQGALVYATYNGITISTITAEEGKFVLEAAKFGLHGSDFEDTLSIPINVDLSYLGGYDTSLTYTTEELSSRTEKDLGLIWSTRSWTGDQISCRRKKVKIFLSQRSMPALPDKQGSVALIRVVGELVYQVVPVHGRSMKKVTLSSVHAHHKAQVPLVLLEIRHQHQLLTCLTPDGRMVYRRLEGVHLLIVSYVNINVR